MNKQDFIDQVERAYRRGFHQAVAEAGRVLRQENDQKYNRWLEAVRLWRNEVNPDELDKCAPPPTYFDVNKEQKIACIKN